MADIQELTAEVDRLQGVVPSAVALINGVVERIEAAVQEAIEANDAADLSAITEEVNQIRAETDALAAAVASNS
jgi:hypothetical protein